MSRSFFPVLNAGVFEAAIEMASPVAGLRPRRAARSRVEKVPKPTMATVSSPASASPMVENTTETTELAVDLETPACAATWVQTSDLFT